MCFERETLPEGVARPSVPQQAAGRGKTILSDHPTGQGTERSAGATQPHGMGGAAASTVTGKLRGLLNIVTSCCHCGKNCQRGLAALGGLWSLGVLQVFKDGTVC